MTPALDTVSTVAASEAVAFPDGIPGFESCRQFVVLVADEAAPFRRLHALDGAGASFLAIDPRAVMNDYRCQLSTADQHRLGANESDSLLWLALVTAEEGGRLTVNLRAPIVINPRTMRGQQVVPYDCLYPLRHVLLEAE